jgi:hypothetical protein
MRIGKNLHPTPHTPHPVPTRNFLPQTLVKRYRKVTSGKREFAFKNPKLVDLQKWDAAAKKLTGRRLFT